MNEHSRGVDEVEQAAGFRRLPDPITLDQTIATQDTTVAPDPTMGRDTETEFMLRNAG